MSPARWLVFMREAFEVHEGERGVFRNRWCKTGGNTFDQIKSDKPSSVADSLSA